jgi:hypothetical protein
MLVLQGLARHGQPFVFGYDGYNIEFRRRNFESETDFFRAFLSKIGVTAESGVPIRHALIRTSEPESDKVFWSTILTKPRGTESPESVKACLRLLYGFKNQVQAALQDICLAERLTGSGVK